MSVPDFRTRLIDLEEETWRALQSSGSAMIPFITSDCIMQFPMGMKLTSTSDPSVSDVLHSEAFVPWKSFELLDIDVTPMGVGEDGKQVGGVVSYLVQAMRKATRDGGEVEFDALCSSVWRWNGEEYKMCFHQQTLAN